MSISDDQNKELFEKIGAMPVGQRRKIWFCCWFLFILIVGLGLWQSHPSELNTSLHGIATFCTWVLVMAVASWLPEKSRKKITSSKWLLAMWITFGVTACFGLAHLLEELLKRIVPANVDQNSSWFKCVELIVIAAMVLIYLSRLLYSAKYKDRQDVESK